jgi:hypothetical protein
VRPSSAVELAFLSAEIRIRDLTGSPVGAVPYVDVVALEIGGPGAKRTGGGFIGGGFGVEAAAEGMLVASALNMLTSRTRVDTVVCLRTRTAELFLHCTDETPDALRIRLSQVFNILRAQNEGPVPRDVTQAQDDVVTNLEKLGGMLEKGLLTREEFEVAKRTLLSEP